MSNEKSPGCLGYLGDDKLPVSNVFAVLILGCPWLAGWLMSIPGVNPHSLSPEIVRAQSESLGTPQG